MDSLTAIIRTKKGSLFVFSIFIYIAALLFYGFWINHYNEKEILQNVDTLLYNHATLLKHILPEDYHDRAIDEQSISIEEDKYIADKLTRIVKETDFKYNYTIIKKRGQTFFLSPVTLSLTRKMREEPSIIMSMKALMRVFQCL